jgi:hypothetical protein
LCEASTELSSLERSKCHTGILAHSRVGYGRYDRCRKTVETPTRPIPLK